MASPSPDQTVRQLGMYPPPFRGSFVHNVTRSVPARNNENSEDSETENWEPPTPFVQHDVPPFPIDVFPHWLREFVEAEAEATQTPLDLPAMIVIAALETACSKRVIVRIDSGWVEPVNGYNIVVLESGNRKSAVVSDATRPIETFEEEEAIRLKPKITAKRTKLLILEKTLKAKSEQAAKASGLERQHLEHEVLQLAEELEGHSVPCCPRLMADDCTPEAMVSLLSSNGGRMAVLSAEGELFDIMGGRYSKKPNFGVYLKGHTGETIRNDRIHRSAEFVENPAITIGMAVQPAVIQGLIQQPEFKGKGLLARFRFSIPASRLGLRKSSTNPVPDSVKEAYHAGLIRLLSLPPKYNPSGVPIADELTLSNNALQVVREFQEIVEPQLGDFGELAAIKDWGSKLPGSVVRLAGILHMAKYALDGDPFGISIEEITVRAAVRIGHYLIQHAKAAFALMGADGTIEAAKYVLAIIRKEGWKQFSKRDAHQKAKGKFKKVEDIELPLSLLVQHGYLGEPRQPPKEGPGRNQSPIYAVNPLTHNARNSQNVEF